MKYPKQFWFKEWGWNIENEETGDNLPGESEAIGNSQNVVSEMKLGVKNQQNSIQHIFSESGTLLLGLSQIQFLCIPFRYSKFLMNLLTKLFFIFLPINNLVNYFLFTWILKYYKLFSIV